MFTPEEIAAQLTRIEHERNEKDEDVPGEDDLLRESPSNIVERLKSISENPLCWHVWALFLLCNPGGGPRVATCYRRR